MTPESVVSLFSDSIYIILLLLAVLILPGLIVGLIISMFQAATQINETSLSFIPKLFVTFLALILAGPWLLKTLINYTDTLISNIPYLIG
ncbi:flagellar biosynthesis protein FliQ [Legionella pneumophila]|uniref:Flagellar biosynthetic protein FliQ n=1 Tax=Legionella pneumophila subsp. pascullei TaxID=91890 RepID=A0AAX2IWV2_LEGPN|nr:flagellar biosynthesis protein FliQ [Legionella pneumophila]AMP89568.1 flagellar export apparatus protein FliQ [Legionella pneumophila subsp. pascullei]AMP92766.1 flagellar biosynthetic protein FliQ [Legionella pneumophila subsp. pascullei]AMP95732.1 flagellar biosynthetic protein FliQ [Legionella pneumophila subsp. pascullei]SQG90644.1 flagellar biosynthetic protein FliQ [Legionella pneumophila subsp. pascullei]VEH07189.1 flagellar biosynthetic protein FliQ [Legionella pneumophila subsp. p